MRMHVIPVALLAAGLVAGLPAFAGEFAWEAMNQDELAQKRGGTETQQDTAQIVAQNNSSELNGTNSQNTVLNSGHWDTGDVIGTTVTGNRGITAVLQNTGDVVNMNYSTSVNVYIR